MSKATERLATYASQIKIEEIPSEVITSAKECILDSMAYMIGGSPTKTGRQIIEMMTEMGERASTAAGSSVRLPAPLAAYINGFLANAPDMEDNYFGMCHPGPAIVPTALTLGEIRQVSGVDLIASVVAGYEVWIRVGKSMLSTGINQSNANGQSTWLMFGGIAATGRLKGFSPKQMMTAFGTAATHASVPFLAKIGYQDRPMSSIKNNFGWTCMGAIMAAELTERGFLGTTNILDGDNGFWRMTNAPQVDWKDSLETIGKIFEISLVQFKKYPSCYGNHPLAEGLNQALSELSVGGDQVHKILIYGAEKLIDFADYDPSTLTDAQFSGPYTAAMILLGKPPGPDWWDEKNFHNPEVVAQAKKVMIVPILGMEEVFKKGIIRTRVNVVTRDGRTASVESEIPLPPENRGLNPEKHRQKLRTLALPVIRHEYAEQILNHIDELENLVDVGNLISLMAKAS